MLGRENLCIASALPGGQLRAVPFVWTLLASGAAIAIWIVWTYNRLITQRNALQEAWSGIEVQLKRRHELVPRLVTCVTAYRDHESAVLESVARARSAAQQAHSARDASAVENTLSGRLRELLVVVEGYPELKADANFRQLSGQLVETEDQLQFARRYFNGVVRDLNNLVESFPSMFVARAGGFRKEAFFAVEAGVERQAPAVNAGEKS